MWNEWEIPSDTPSHKEIIIGLHKILWSWDCNLKVLTTLGQDFLLAEIDLLLIKVYTELCDLSFKRFVKLQKVFVETFMREVMSFQWNITYKVYANSHNSITKCILYLKNSDTQVRQKLVSFSYPSKCFLNPALQHDFVFYAPLQRVIISKRT